MADRGFHITFRVSEDERAAIQQLADLYARRRVRGGISALLRASLERECRANGIPFPPLRRATADPPDQDS